MKLLAVPMLALAFAAFALPAAAGGCSWSTDAQTEKPKDKAENPSA